MKQNNRQFSDDQEEQDPNVIWMDHGAGYVIPHEGHYLAVGNRIAVTRGADILMQTRLIALGAKVDRGNIVAATTPAWTFLRDELLTNPTLFDYFPVWHRKFEEFLAGAYREAHWSDVVLSPRSRDGGFDIAAYKRGRQILDEAKAFRSSRSVTHQIVLAALGLLALHDDVDQVRVTTSSSFAPNVIADIADIANRISDKLNLRDRSQLMRWLRSIGTKSKASSSEPRETSKSKLWEVYF